MYGSFKPPSIKYPSRTQLTHKGKCQFVACRPQIAERHTVKSTSSKTYFLFCSYHSNVLKKESLVMYVFGILEATIEQNAHPIEKIKRKTNK